MTFSPRLQAIAYRFLLGLVVVEIPVFTALLSSPTPDYRLLMIGLLGGLATAVEKYLSPQLVTMTGGVSTMKQADPTVVTPGYDG